MSTAGTATSGTGQVESHPPRRVVLLSESAGLAALLRHLLGRAARLHRFGSLREALDRDGLEDADTVVLDLPRDSSDTLVVQVRHRYRGALVVLADEGHPPLDLPPHSTCKQLTRPFSALALGAALGLPGYHPSATAAAEPVSAPARPGPLGAATGASPPRAGATADRGPAATGQAAAAAGPSAAASDAKAVARRAPSWWAQQTTAGAIKDGLGDWVTRSVAALTQSWQARRRVRVAGFSVFALVAFTVAFALAAQGRCGPGCDALGTGFSPRPTIAPSESSAPQTSRPRRAPASTAATAGSPETGAFRGVTGGGDGDGGGLATTTTGERATTTTRKPGSGGSPPRPTSPTTRPPTTAPPTTAPPTTAPPTTAPPTTAEPTLPPGGP